MQTRREIIEEMDYTGDAIDWNKMFPPEDERYAEYFLSVDKVLQALGEEANVIDVPHKRQVIDSIKKRLGF